MYRYEMHVSTGAHSDGPGIGCSTGADAQLPVDHSGWVLARYRTDAHEAHGRYSSGICTECGDGAGTDTRHQPSHTTPRHTCATEARAVCGTSTMLFPRCMRPQCDVVSMYTQAPFDEATDEWWPDAFCTAERDCAPVWLPGDTPLLVLYDCK